MNLVDKDLQSVQEVRSSFGKDKRSHKKLAVLTQSQINDITKAVCEATYKERVRLAKLAHEETGFGKWEDKVLKKCVCIKTSLCSYERYENGWCH